MFFIANPLKIFRSSFSQSIYHQLFIKICVFKVLEKCKECRQVIHKDEIKMFEGDHPDAVSYE